MRGLSETLCTELFTLFPSVPSSHRNPEPSKDPFSYDRKPNSSSQWDTLIFWPRHTPSPGARKPRKRPAEEKRVGCLEDNGGKMGPGDHRHGEWMPYRPEQICHTFGSVSSRTHNGERCILPLSRKAQSGFKTYPGPFLLSCPTTHPLFEVPLPTHTSLSILSFSITSGSPLFPQVLMISSIVETWASTWLHSSKGAIPASSLPVTSHVRESDHNSKACMLLVKFQILWRFRGDQETSLPNGLDIVPRRCRRPDI